MAADVLMVQSTTSGAGKSLLVAALCRLYAAQGRRVAPFKCQNMSLNSFATRGGGEIGRSQALQAQAARIEPHVDMNPILLKPSGRRGCQVIVLGRPVGHYQAIEYERLHGELFPTAMAALDRLRAAYDIVIAEGAGTPAEINLRDRDIANMAVARHARCPVLLVGDIDRGGVFASLVGTIELLSAADRRRVSGLVINKMRGDPAVLAPGLDELTRRTGVPVVGVIPYLADLGLDEEDALDLGTGAGVTQSGALSVAVVRLPHISNFTDFQVLGMEPGVSVAYVDRPGDLAGAHAVILPGSKETLADLAWLRDRGLDAAILAHHRGGGIVLGVCGGYQMLGQRLGADPGAGHPSPGLGDGGREVAGLGLLPVATAFGPDKRVVQARARTAAGFLGLPAGLPLAGYEIHVGRTRRAEAGPFATVTAADGREYPEGAIAADGRAAGTYLHGLFDSDAYRREWIAAARRHVGLPAARGAVAAAEAREAALDRLAEAVEAGLDMAAVDRLMVAAGRVERC